MLFAAKNAHVYRSIVIVQPVSVLHSCSLLHSASSVIVSFKASQQNPHQLPDQEEQNCLLHFRLVLPSVGHMTVDSPTGTIIVWSL